jgi:hypothetical protein
MDLDVGIALVCHHMSRRRLQVLLLFQAMPLLFQAMPLLFLVREEEEEEKFVNCC